MTKENDLISIALWAAHRLTDTNKKYVLEELLKSIGDNHEYNDFINKELSMIQNHTRKTD